MSERRPPSALLSMSARGRSLWKRVLGFLTHSAEDALKGLSFRLLHLPWIQSLSVWHVSFPKACFLICSHGQSLGFGFWCWFITTVRLHLVQIPLFVHLISPVNSGFLTCAPKAPGGMSPCHRLLLPPYQVWARNQKEPVQQAHVSRLSFINGFQVTAQPCRVLY